MASWRRRRRRKAPRKKARFRMEGMTAAELGAKVGVTARTVRFYTAERVLPSPEFRGAATRYSREHLICLAAIRWLQREKRMSLPAIRDYLRGVDQDEVRRVAGLFLPELVAAPAVQTVESAPAAATVAITVSDTWHRLTIIPGLELHLHSTVSADIQRVARDLSEKLREFAAQRTLQG
jgi:DNA-binding transcriptional MerR regulator